MLTKMQTLRSSVSTNRPASGTQAPGVLYVNFADLQLGVMNTAGDPQDLLAVTFFSDQAVYAPGDIVVEGGNIWVAGAATGPGAFNPAAWLQVGGSASVSVDPPSNPSPGQFWFNPTNGQLHIFYVDVDTGQWVSVSGFGGGGGAAAITPPTVGYPTGNVQAWCCISSTGALVTGMNISSVTATAAGKYDLSFSSPMSSANYAVAGAGHLNTWQCITVDGTGGARPNPSTTGLAIMSGNTNGYQHPTPAGIGMVRVIIVN
jgi:hypothetical protein